MLIKITKMAAVLLAAVGMALCLTGCVSNINGGLSDISYANAEQYTPGAAELTQTVEQIEIHWPVGTVTVKPHGSDTVSFSEESAKDLADDEKLHYWLDGATLHIQFCQAEKWLLGDMKKDLTVLVPEDLALAEVEVGSISAEVSLDGLRVDRLSVDTTSGNMRLTGCAVTELVSVSTVSGDLEAELAQPLGTFSGDSTSGTFEISAPGVESFCASTVSGEVSLLAEKEPERLSVESTSGNIDLALPVDAAFALDYDATSGELSSDLPYTMKGGRYIFADGKGEYEISTVSGDVRITAAE